MNGKKAKMLRKKFNVKRTSHTEGNQDYDYETVWGEYFTGKLDKEGKPLTMKLPTFVASLKEGHPRKLYKQAKKVYTQTKEVI